MRLQFTIMQAESHLETAIVAHAVEMNLVIVSFPFLNFLKSVACYRHSGSRISSTLFFNVGIFILVEEKLESKPLHTQNLFTRKYKEIFISIRDVTMYYM
jgi:hypothetical protein